MKCVRCNRSLLGPTVTVKNRDGEFWYGPVCAKRAGISGIKERRERFTSTTATRAKARRDDRQLVLPLEATA